MAPPKPLSLGNQPAVQTPTPMAPASVTQSTQMVPVVPQAVVPATNNTLTQVGTPASQAVAPLTLESVNKVGAASQRQVADVSSRLASAVKTSEMDALGDLLGKTLVAAKGYDPANTKGKFFGMIKRKVEEIRIGYESAENTTNRLVAEMDKRIGIHRQRDADIKQMIQINRKCYDDLGVEIETLSGKLDWMEANVPVADPGDAMGAQKVQEWQTIIAMGRKHADDLNRTRVVCQQMDAQMQMLGQQGLMLVQKFDGFKTTTMPILRQAFVMYIMALEQERSAKMANSIDDLTDQTLLENARKMGQTTVAVHGSLARSNISLEAIQEGYKATVQALDDIERIRTEMKARLASEAPQIEQASRELAARLARPAA